MLTGGKKTLKKPTKREKVKRLTKGDIKAILRPTKGELNVVLRQLRIQWGAGGWQGSHGPPVPLKKMAATCGALYFMFLAPSPLTILDPMLYVLHREK